MDYIIIIYIVLGILPSLTWLFYYIAKDAHPEPKKTILKIFLWGTLTTLPVFFVQLGLASWLAEIELNAWLTGLLYWFFIIAFSEELFKYLVVKLKVLNSPDLDEPLDIMLYMVVAALGFAALENILYLFTPANGMSFNQLVDRALIITFIRFIGATFLHTLCSAIVGYAMAMSFFRIKTGRATVIFGLLIATLLHGLYNFSIMTLEGTIKFALPAIIILTLAFVVFMAFEKLKKAKGVCQLNEVPLPNSIPRPAKNK